MTELLVLGVGNLLLTDDGLGVLAAQELMRESWPQGVIVREAGTFTQDMFHAFREVERLLVLDVVHTGGKPGSIHLLGERDLIHRKEQRLSIHDIGLLDSLHMAERLYGTRPALRVLGMEPQDITTWNIGLSPVAAACFPRYLELVRNEMERWLAEARRPAVGNETAR